MRHVRILGLCLAAVLAVGAWRGVECFGGLEWGKCVKLGPAKTGTRDRTRKAEKAKPKGSGSYEWRKASEVAANERGSKVPGVPSGHNAAAAASSARASDLRKLTKKNLLRKAAKSAWKAKSPRSYVVYGR